MRGEILVGGLNGGSNGIPRSQARHHLRVDVIVDQVHKTIQYLI